LPGYEWLQGMLTDPKTNEKVRKLKVIADELGCTLAQLSLAWCTKNKRVSTVITGASRASQVRENMGALSVAARLDRDVMALIDAVERVPEPLRNRGAPHVCFVADDHHSVDAVDLQPDLGQRPRGLRRVSAAARIDVQPVPDLEGAGSTARHEPERTEERVIGAEQPVLPLLGAFTLPRLIAQSSPLEFHVRRLRIGPGH